MRASTRRGRARRRSRGPRSPRSLVPDDRARPARPRPDRADLRLARVVATYSIAACDLDAGQWGVATQSKFLAVGSVVPWAEPHVGAIATQAYANPRYGPEGLALLRAGLSAEEVVEHLDRGDDGREHRQLGVVDAERRGASYTGSECMDWAGGRTGTGFAAQGNILVSGETVDALAETFVSTAGAPLAERLLDCLAAAQAAGGDRRGQQSAALLVVETDGGYAGLSDVVVDLRVDDHARAARGAAHAVRASTSCSSARRRREEWLEVDDDLAPSSASGSARLGYDGALDAFDAGPAPRTWRSA